MKSFKVLITICMLVLLQAAQSLPTDHLDDLVVVPNAQGQEGIVSGNANGLENVHNNVAEVKGSVAIKQANSVKQANSNPDTVLSAKSALFGRANCLRTPAMPVKRSSVKDSSSKDQSSKKVSPNPASPTKVSRRWDDKPYCHNAGSPYFHDCQKNCKCSVGGDLMLCNPGDGRDIDNANGECAREADCHCFARPGIIIDEPGSGGCPGCRSKVSGQGGSIQQVGGPISGATKRSPVKDQSVKKVSPNPVSSAKLTRRWDDRPYCHNAGSRYFADCQTKCKCSVKGVLMLCSPGDPGNEDGPNQDCARYADCRCFARPGIIAAEPISRGCTGCRSRVNGQGGSTQVSGPISGATKRSPVNESPIKESSRSDRTLKDQSAKVNPKPLSSAKITRRWDDRPYCHNGGSPYYDVCSKGCKCSHKGELVSCPDPWHDGAGADDACLKFARCVCFPRPGGIIVEPVFSGGCVGCHNSRVP